MIKGFSDSLTPQGESAPWRLCRRGITPAIASPLNTGWTRLQLRRSCLPAYRWRRNRGAHGRRFLNALLWMARSGRRWRDFPSKIGDYETGRSSALTTPNSTSGAASSSASSTSSNSSARRDAIRQAARQLHGLRQTRRYRNLARIVKTSPRPRGNDEPPKSQRCDGQMHIGILNEQHLRAKVFHQD
jgi:transposase